MANTQRLILAAVSCWALAGCEDNPDQFYKRAAAGSGDRWNNGQTPAVYDPNARNSFTDSYNGSSKQELCSGAVKQKVWADMVKQDIKPPRNIAGLDLAGKDENGKVLYTGLDFRDAEKVLCQSKSLAGDDTMLQAGWGDANEVAVLYKIATNAIDTWYLNPGYTGKLKFKSRPTNLKDPSKPNPRGQHTYEIGVNVPIVRDGKNYPINWTQTCTTPTSDEGTDTEECFEKQATELFDAMMYTFDPGLPSTQKSCVEAQTCLAKFFPDGEAIIGVRPLGIYIDIGSYFLQQPAASTPRYLYGFYVKLMPFSASTMFLKLDQEGPTATAVGLGDKQKTCTQKLGMDFKTFVEDCVDVNAKPEDNAETRAKLFGGMGHDKEAFDFSIEGVNLDFVSSKIGESGMVGDDQLPDNNDHAHEFNMDIRASGTVRNEFDESGKVETFGGTGAIYREYVRRVQNDIHAKLADYFPPEPMRNNQCAEGWVKDGDSGNCRYQGFEIGDLRCASATPARGCTGFENFVTPASHEVGPTEGVKRFSIGVKAKALGYKTALKAGDPAAVFCNDPAPNASGADVGEDGKQAVCTADAECFSNACNPNASIPKPESGTCPAGFENDETDANKCKETVRRCAPANAKFFKQCTKDSLLNGSWQRVTDVLGRSFKQDGSVEGEGALKNLPPALRDRKYYFRHWAFALVKYLKAANKFPKDLGAPEFMPGGHACDVENLLPGFEQPKYGCEPEPDHLLFDQIGDSGDSDKFEYIDRRFVDTSGPGEKEPLKIEYQILISSSNQQEWKFHRKMTRPERSLYMALSSDRNKPPATKDDNVRISNIVGSPVLTAGWGTGEEAWKCASTLVDGEPLPGCSPPMDSRTGKYMLDDYGQPLLTNYKGAFTGTVFSIGTRYMKMVEELPYNRSAKISVPFWDNPYAPPAPGAGIAAGSAPVVLVDWRPETPGNGIRIPLNGQYDKFYPSATASFTGSSLTFDLDYALQPDKSMLVEALQSDNYMGNLFVCQDGATGDLLSIEQYESMEVILDWLEKHPGAEEACNIIIRPSATLGRPILFAAKGAGLVLNIGQGSGIGRITKIEIFDPSLL